MSLRGRRSSEPPAGGDRSTRDPAAGGTSTTTTGTRCTSPTTGNRFTPLPRSFYHRPTLVVARDLLGALLIREKGGRRTVGRIIECEAYTDRNDPASHSRRGRTPANSMMYAPGGHLYVYFTYGMHFCANVVTEGAGRGCAVLLRALEPMEGLDLMARRRGAAARGGRNLCTGPAKLCQAFGIGREENGIDLCRGPIWIARGTPPLPGRVLRTPRIGIREGKEKLWRFVLSDSPRSPG